MGNIGTYHGKLELFLAFFNISYPILNPVIWKEKLYWVVGTASSRDHFNSRLKAAPTGVFFGYFALLGCSWHDFTSTDRYY